MSTSPQLFDMSKATPIGQPAQSGKPLFDMSKATPVAAAQNTPLSPKAQTEMNAVDLPGTFKALREPPMKGYPVPIPGAVSGAVAKLIEPTATVIPGGAGFGGAAATTVAGPSIAQSAASGLGQIALKYGIKALGAGGGGVVAYRLYNDLKKLFE